MKPKAAHIFARSELEWYVEPSWVTDLLLTQERFDGPIHDPCCGTGNIVQSLLNHGLVATGSDIVQRAEASWFTGASDFTKTSDPLVNVVMNPPFYRAKGTEQFIRLALDRATKKVAVFTDLRFLCGKERATGLFKERPPTRVWIITPRPSCPPGSYLEEGGKAQGGTADWCWMVWDINQTQVGWLIRP